MELGGLRRLLAAAGMLVAFGVPEAASAATYTVDDADDVADATPGDATCDAVGLDGCTLRAAVETAANASSPGDDVVELPFDVALTLGELTATGNGALTIRGTGAGRKAIDAGDLSRILSVSGVPLALEQLILRNGRAEDGVDYQGGAILYQGFSAADKLSLDDARIEDSESLPTAAAPIQGQGGAVSINGGALELTASEIVGNTAGDAENSGLGGGIYLGSSSPEVTVTDSTIDANTAVGGVPGARGGGIAVVNSAGAPPVGSVTFTSSTVSDNRAGGAGTFTAGNGGGAYLAGAPAAAPELKVIASQFTDNVAGGGSGNAEGIGGGVAVNEAGGGVFLNGASFDGNRAGGNDMLADGTGSGTGGAIRSRSSLEAVDSTFTSNRAGVTASGDVHGTGGALLVEGPNAVELALTDSLFQDNRAGTGDSALSHGGAVRALNGGVMEISGSSFVDNEARRAGGALDRFRDTTVGDADTIANSRFVSNVSAGDGAGIHSASNRSLTISGTEVSLNGTTGEFNNRGGGLALGAITDTQDPLIAIRNTTVSQNSANGPTGIGGGLILGTFFASVPTEAQLTNVTLAGNSAGQEGGNLRIAGDGADEPVVRVRGSIVTDGTAPAGSDCHFLNLGSLDYASEGGNVESGTDCDFSNGGMGDDQNADPMLAARSDNGDVGQSGQTHALLSGSPAIDNVPAALCAGVTTDQRGYPRPSSGGTDCDSGAYELFVCNGSPLNQAGAFPGCTPPPTGATPTPATSTPTKKKCKKKKKKKAKKRAAGSAKKKKKCKKKKRGK